MVECISGKTLLIISGGIEAVPGIQKAKQMGLHVVVSDGSSDAPGFNYSDDQIIASTYNVDGTLQKAKHYHEKVRNIDGVICIASDVPLTVASVAKELDLPGIPIETAKLAMDKLSMKDRFSDAGIPVPEYMPLNNLEDLFSIVNDWDFPLVIKPVDSRGARGVLRLTKDVDLRWAWNHALENSPNKRVMVERFLDGPQVSTEAIIIDGIGYPIGFSDRNYEFIDRFAPYIIENGGGFPSHLDHDDQIAIADMSIKAGLALGINNGIAKGDMVLTNEGPQVIEIAARLSGGWLSTDQIPLGLGIDLIGSAIKLALGEKIDVKELIPQYHKGVAIRYFFPEPGIVKGINIPSKYENVNWVHRVGLFVKPGDRIGKVTNHTRRTGFVITTGKTNAIAAKRSVDFANSIQMNTVLDS
jgi:biotin carboxylase